MNSSEPKFSNRLLQESSPYLLQHAHNPVDWHAWNDAAWEKARKENKPVIVSIGYSACHWCHVMEHESFEDEEVANLMNEKFICIKVDREERPDVDGVYMSAVQIMTGSGGWPLNCFTLPDGRPVFGGTYFPKEKWMQALTAVADLYAKEPDRVFQYAEELTAAVQKSELVTLSAEPPPFSKDTLNACYENWQKRFDNVEGGPNRAPKFPLPNNYLFLLRYAQTLNEWEKDKLMKHVDLTLTKMAYGGIYDQIGGGFARYSTDGLWKAPHFEKMLYDNGQLVSLYAEAYQATKNPLYKQVVYETLEFIRREMTSPQGAFYSALDADSEGEEGRYYVWEQEELQEALGEDFKLFAEYFNVNEAGLWEDNYILLRKRPDEEIAKKFSLSAEELQNKITGLKKKVLAAREKRVRPGLDNKILTSWNALMIKGYADAYKVFGEKEFLDAAVRAASYLLENLQQKGGGLLHSKHINGFLEDLSFPAEAFIALYQVTFDVQWLNIARALCDHAVRHFYDAGSGMFCFTSDADAALIARKMELQDNVIPSSNSSMALALFYLGKYFDLNEYLALSEKMLKRVQAEMIPYGSAYSNWGLLLMHHVFPFYEIAIVGKHVDEKRKQLFGRYIPSAIFAGGRSEDGLPLLRDKFVEGKTLIYVCENKTCKPPIENIIDALDQITTG